MFTGASETLRLSGIDENINASGRYRAVKPRVPAMDRATQMEEIRRLLGRPVPLWQAAGFSGRGSGPAAARRGR